MNELAGRIHSEADARELTDAIAKLFADSLPSEWVAERIRTRIAHAEYEAVADPWRLISEQRINLQDLRQRIYRKAKAEAVGWGGVDAGEKSGSKAPPIGYVS